MLEIILTPHLQYLFKKLANSGIKLLREGESRIELSEKIRRWEEHLGDIEGVPSDDSTKKWVNDLQDWAYDLEDILDDIATEVKLNDLNVDLQDGDSGSCSAPRSLVSSARRSLVYSVLRSLVSVVPRLLNGASGDSPRPECSMYSSRLEEIDKRLQVILERKKSLKPIVPTQSREKRSEENVGTSSLKPVVHGRVDEKSEIIKRLLENDENRYVVIPVVGQGGIGKTTLAQSVYNDEEYVKAHFDTQAWVCVSDVFDVKHITTLILSSATNGNHCFNDLNQAQVELENHLQRQKFLIVLDDVWSDDYLSWEQLQIPFRAAAMGSRLIVTTRLKEVAKNMLTTPTENAIIFLQGLSNDDCWRIFKQHALVNDDDPVNMGNEVLGVINGLPLAAKALGGLFKKNHKSKWARILRNTDWSEQGGVLPVLRLSYNHLPHHLKRVFAYCSIIPKDYEFEEKKIVQMWMAEGFLVETEEESMEDTGHEYFHDLVSRSLFDEPRTTRYGERGFIMHDLIHDLAQWAAVDVCSIDKGSSRTRYLSLSTQYIMEEEAPIPTEIGNVGHLRTFSYFSCENEFVDIPLQLLDSIFQQFQYLRVLSLVKLGGTELPNSIGKLKHLRCLDLSFNRRLKELPESIINLRNLQTLVLEGCYSLKTLVSNMESLIELRHLYIECELPMGIEKLTKLRSLNKIKLSAETGHRIRELKNLSSLSGSLQINRLSHLLEANDAKEAKLLEKSGLEVVSISFIKRVRILEDEDIGSVLNQLQPPNSLKELSLKRYMALEFPPWLGDPSFINMVVIKLIGCRRCKCLPPLGQLQTLQEIHIEWMSGITYVGPEFFGDGCLNSFPALKVLKFKDMEYWEKWLPLSVDKNRVFPCLEVLSIISCRSLEDCFPPHAHMPSSLKEIKVDFCPKLKVSLPTCASLNKLYLYNCRELSSNSPVICCSESITLQLVKQFSGFERFWVPKPNFVTVNSELSFLFPNPRNRSIHLENCPELHTWGYDENGALNSLTEVTIEGNNEAFIVFLEGKQLPNLKKLIICRNEFLKKISTFTKQSFHLQHLEIKNVEIEEPAKEWGLHLLTSLKTLEIVNAGSSTDAVESIPDPDLHLPTSLVDLTIVGFRNLKFLSCSTLPNIKTLNIRSCPSFTRDCIHVNQDMEFEEIYPEYWKFTKVGV